MKLRQQPKGLSCLCDMLGVACLVLSPTIYAAGANSSSGFLTDYTLLKSAAGQGADADAFNYLAPDITERLRGYQAILIEQPVIAIAADSKVKALKPDDAKLIADTLGQILADDLSTEFMVVDRPAKGVLIIRTGLTNVYLQKKKRPVLGYLPVGFVITTAKRAFLDDVMAKINLAQVVLEMEAVDAESGTVLAAVQDPAGDRSEKREFTSWSELEGQLGVYAQRFACRIANTRRDSASQVDCGAIDAPSGAQ